MTEKLYHYTSINVLYSIVSNQELWLSNLKNSNDPNEMYLSCEEYNQYIDKLNISPYHGTPLILSKNQVMGAPYGISLTTLNDSLSQWERYGDNLKGVSIQFDINFLIEYISNNYRYKFSFGGMKYTETEKVELIKNNLATMPEFKNFIWEHDWPICATYFLIHFSEARALFKNEYFAQENEYRLFFDPIEYDFFHSTILKFKHEKAQKTIEAANEDYLCAKNILHLLKDDKKYALMRNGINSYFTLDLNLFGNDRIHLIKEICLGPKCTQSEEELLNFLLQHGYNPKITRSKISVR